MPSGCGFPPLRRDRHRTEAGDVERAVAHLDAGDDGDAVEERLALELREARLRALLQAAEEALERFIEPLERPALDGDPAFGHFRQLRPALGEGLALVEVCARLPGLPVEVDPFLKCRVVELPLRFERGLQPLPVAPRLRKQPVDNLPVRLCQGHVFVPA